MRKPDKHFNCLKSVQSLPRWFVAGSTRGHRRSFMFLLFYYVSLVSKFLLLCHFCHLIFLDCACIVVWRESIGFMAFFGGNLWLFLTCPTSIFDAHLTCLSSLLIDLCLTRGHLIVRSLHGKCKHILVNVPKIDQSIISEGQMRRFRSSM